MRTLAFTINVFMRAEDTTTPEVEDLMEAIVNAIDNDITLAGIFAGGIRPITSNPEPFQHNGRDLIVLML